MHGIFRDKTLIDLIYGFAVQNKNKLSKDVRRESISYFDIIEKEEVYANDNKKEFTILYGRIKTREYGFELELLDITDGSIYERSTTQADLLPFGFRYTAIRESVSYL